MLLEFWTVSTQYSGRAPPPAHAPEAWAHLTLLIGLTVLIEEMRHSWRSISEVVVAHQSGSLNRVQKDGGSSNGPPWTAHMAS
ncbi:hypothetical protein NDU88_003647 [Pleurodeles waltl]|uniref:Uncharacterized protein n=1 Tax=Pleurodeles waltl TaxID=8319 RepID=A0AAV7LSL3_PLEWA|nr:hypothetical protein NDU88_003647 [Pleurodeles waltl]